MGNAVSNNPHPLREIFHDGSAQHATTTPSVEFDGINRSRQTVTTSIVRNKLETKHFPLSVIVDQSTQTSNTAYSEKKNASPRPFKKSCIILFCIYLAICIFLCTSGSLQSVLVYLHIIRFPFGDLKNLQRFGLSNARNVNFTTEDGILLHGYHLVPMVGIRNHKKRVSEWDSSDFDYSLAHAERIVIFFHGNGATRAYSNRIDIIKQLTTVLDAHVITFDYRGFGDSTGWPSEHGTLLDARAVTKWLHSVVTKHNLHSEGYCPEKKSFLSNLLGKKKSLERSAIDDRSGGATPQLILYGHSLGTAISTAITAELNQLAPRAVSGLILDSPFSSLMEAIESHPVAVLFRFFPLLKRIM
jgi:abhydrolase domain-containing protein 12